MEESENQTPANNSLSLLTQKKPSKHEEQLSAWWLLAITGAVVGIYLLVYWNWVSMPIALRRVDESTYPDRFIAEVAKQHLFEMSNVGPRVAGSYANEIITVQFLLRIINEIIAESNPAHRIELEVQQAYGNMFLDYEKYPQTSVYQGIQNVVARIVPSQGKEPDNYLMLSSHFDSVPQSPGAGDDGTMSVIMLEVLRKMSQNPHPYNHGIVFVFNGCEENTLQGSHAFVTHHRWFDKVRTFINMDVAANGGRDIMFQAGPKYSFLMKYYRDNVPHPYCTAVAEELFQADLVPSETDYYVYSKYGKIPGMDFAHSTWGYLYHTAYDTYDTIPNTTLQHTGDNVLALAKALANAEELYDIREHEGSKAVFFDFLHWFLVYYPLWASILLNIGLSVIALSAIILSLWLLSRNTDLSLWQLLLQDLTAMGVVLLSIVVGAGLSLLLAVILNAVDSTMAWFTQTWLIFGLYICPFLIATCSGPVLYIHIVKNNRLSLHARVQLLLHATCALYVLILIVLTGMSIRSGYLFTMAILFYTVTTLVNALFKRASFYWIYVHLVGQIAPIAYFSSVSLTAFGTFIPMQGRGNAGANPELLIALFAVLVGLLVTGFLTPLVALTRKGYLFISLIFVFFIISIIVMVTSAGFPFRAHTSPERFYIYHCTREFYHQNGTLRRLEGGFYVHPQDRYTGDLIRELAIKSSANAVPLGDQCEKELYCGIPFYQNSHHGQRENGLWIKDNTFTIPETIDLQYIGNQHDSNLSTTTFYFTVKGTDHMSFYVSPVRGVQLVDWSFSKDIPRSGLSWNGQDVHYINFVHGIDDKPHEFYITVQGSASKSSETGWNFYLNVVAQYMHHEQYRTREFRQFIDQFPDYAHVVAYPAHLISKIF
ncbi:endoplasmic reticulum metallopeptidase 1-like [Anopheles maculipalpis]|uniref:endoplasmic reticulum metallopeptidase 1-like n=1 Tax=Anopheles maculipalpis TaxID=1496333 RepID=UPI0021593EFB|nr:endoplasmic reticulum metallopeptidase 1-like [Anopheles maculipalpis]